MYAGGTASGRKNAPPLVILGPRSTAWLLASRLQRHRRSLHDLPRLAG